ncbi:hypothetical protein [Streptomyces triticiradicis]|uniref:hypothetical protein n=1 Tax=Streptomyces triticiradicis TaxID=2651189 RepID=UPI001788C41B|nr:hypothetical protein [Streptomyces triticiradicis]
MGTTLTPEFWRQFTVLLVIATAVVVVVGAALDALVLRTRGRRTPPAPPTPAEAWKRQAAHGVSARH